MIKEHHSSSPIDNKNLAILTLADFLAAETGLGNFTWENIRPFHHEFIKR